MENEVVYNSRKSKNNPLCLNWSFLIINRNNKKISEITTSVYNLFSPIIKKYPEDDGDLKKGLKYKLINFDSEKILYSGWKSNVFWRTIRDKELPPIYNPAFELYISNLKDIS